jgi:hypothetical protein
MGEQQRQRLRIAATGEQGWDHNGPSVFGESCSLGKTGNFHSGSYGESAGVGASLGDSDVSRQKHGSGDSQPGRLRTRVVNDFELEPGSASDHRFIQRKRELCRQCIDHANGEYQEVGLTE